MENNEPTILQAGIKDVKFGKNCQVVMPANLYGCTLGDDCFVGPFSEVQSNCVIGDRTRIHSHSLITDMTTIGTDCFIGHGVMMINDLFKKGGPAGGDRSLWKANNIGNFVTIGNNVTLLPVTICDYVVIGAGSVVTRDINVPGIYAGNPAKLIRRLNPEEIKRNTP